jgi:hypothetical protein
VESEFRWNLYEPQAGKKGGRLGKGMVCICRVSRRVISRLPASQSAGSTVDLAKRKPRRVRALPASGLVPDMLLLEMTSFPRKRVWWYCQTDRDKYGGEGTSKSSQVNQKKIEVVIVAGSGFGLFSQRGGPKWKDEDGKVKAAYTSIIEAPLKREQKMKAAINNRHGRAMPVMWDGRRRDRMLLT